MSQMQTYSGNRFDLENPTETDVRLIDVAMSLSKKCRFNGSCTRFYSVAEHSILVSRMVPEEFALQGLMHDAAEAYTPDIQARFKQMMFEASPEVEKMFTTIEEVVANAFGLPWPPDPRVKEADLRILATERLQVMAPCTYEWQPLPEPYDNVLISGTDHTTVAVDFIKRFQEVTS